MSTTTYENLGHTHQCAATGAALSPHDRICAALVESLESGELSRIDFAEHAWDEGARPDAAAFELVGFWRTQVPEPTGKKSPIVAAGELMDLFDQLEDADQHRRVAFRYLLALQLIRKRQLMLEGSKQTGGKEVLLVRRKGEALPPERGGEGPPLTEVVNPGLDEAVIADLMDELDAVIAPEARS